MTRVWALLATIAVIVLGGALVPARALATHVGCGDTITADTTLDSDLIDCPGNGLVMGADGIALDLAGHTIEGGGGFGVSTGVAPDGTGYDELTIENGAIHGFRDDVALFDSSGDRLSDLSVTGGHDGVLL